MHPRDTMTGVLTPNEGTKLNDRECGAKIKKNYHREREREAEKEKEQEEDAGMDFDPSHSYKHTLKV